MTSPTPAISEERVGEIEALARRLVDIRVAKKALVDAEEWEQAAAKREEERVAQRVVVEWLNESPAEFLALIARLREASEDTGRPFTIAFSEEEFIALNNFMSYGATRGNHRDDTGVGAGPLTPYVNTFVELNRRMAEVRLAARNQEPDHAE